jgi:hypothetical protein
MNPALSRLVLDPNCHAIVDGNQRGNFGEFNDTQNLDGLIGRRWCVPDHAAFKRLVNQWGFAIAPSAMHSARTTGFGGFHISAESVYTKIDSGAAYWQEGTRGPRDPSSNAASTHNASPADLLQVYSAKVRKSFGFGLELTTSVGFMPETTILTGGADVRMSLLEGFRTGALGILPDLAVGSGVRTITGTSEFQLTVVGLDAQISKPLAISSMSQLTPWIGYQYLWIFGDSGLIDTTPATDPLGYCGFSGVNVPGNRDTSKDGTASDGQPVCAEGASPIDFNNNVVFNNARLERQRLMFGVNYRYEMVMVGGQFMTDIIDPADAQVGDDSFTEIQNGNSVKVTDEDALKDVPRQWSLVLEIGAMF